MSAVQLQGGGGVPLNIMETRRPNYIPVLPDLTRVPPIIPLLCMNDLALHNVTLFPLIPAFAGSLDCICAGSASGLMLWVSQWQVCWALFLFRRICSRVTEPNTYDTHALS